MMKFGWISLVALMVFLVPASSRADIIVLQNGRTLEGEILEQTGDYLEIKLGSGKMRLNRKDIKSFEIKEPAEGYSTVELPDLEVIPEEAEINKPASADVKLKAEFMRNKVLVSGTSSYPNNTPLRVYFMQGESIVMVKESRVKRGEFYVAFGPFKKEIMAGKYTVRAEASVGGGKVYSEPFAVTIGTVERAKADETRAREYLADVAKEADGLYKELNRSYENFRTSNDGPGWKDWSKKWASKVSAAEKRFKDDSGAYLVSLHPVSQRRLQFCFRQLPLLLRAYTIALNSAGARSSGHVLPVQNAKILRQSFDDALSGTVRELSISTAGLE